MKQLDLSRDQIKLEAKEQKLEVFQQIKQIYFDFLSNQQKYKSAQEALESAEQAVFFIKKSYEAGRSSIYDYNNSRNNFIRAQSDQLTAKYSTIFSYKMFLYETTGHFSLE